MPFNIKKRGKLTYYFEGEDPVLSAMVVEEQIDGDLRIHFSGLTGGHSATGILNLDTVTSMEQSEFCRFDPPIGPMLRKLRSSLKHQG